MGSRLDSFQNDMSSPVQTDVCDVCENLAQRCDHLQQQITACMQDDIEISDRIWNVLRQRVDDRLGDELKKLILGTLQAAITPMASFVEERIMAVEKKVEFLGSSDVT